MRRWLRSGGRPGLSVCSCLDYGYSLDDTWQDEAIKSGEAPSHCITRLQSHRDLPKKSVSVGKMASASSSPCLENDGVGLSRDNCLIINIKKMGPGIICLRTDQLTSQCTALLLQAFFSIIPLLNQVSALSGSR
jgi:hypothetical protein